ncbi:MAG: aminotransferase class V-fold PLP-dependent enzyme [Oligoflexia bacterium]|nr:aminotransferase class V-fold PLP-dependent enzyme [Oligoflexia bacterium]MBF0367367.1 aminotransferase class V-fold PLP-dependent enzyme [Oligoflexia bacterium]
MVHQCEEALLQLFALSHSHRILFHSGGSEGISFVLKAHLGPLHIEATDHPAVHATFDWCRKRGWDSKKGELCNLTYVNNETGRVTTLGEMEELKRKKGALIHVDAVQMPGRVPSLKLSSDLDFYTFSGHKFGALPGSGFTLIPKSLYATMMPLIHGSSSSIRGGSENVMGIQSLLLALTELQENFAYDHLLLLKQEFTAKLKQLFEERIVFFSGEGRNYSPNTMAFALTGGVSGDTLQTALDLAGVEVGRGAACASGSNRPSHVLLAEGVDESLAKGFIRISYSPLMSKEQFDQAFTRIASALKTWHTKCI